MGITPHQPEPCPGSFAHFSAVRRFPALDGLRAASVLLVVTVHLHSEAWRPLVGEQGVTAFFVLSGFIITTLLIREEAAAGRISLRGFYVRRAFRIVPLYAVVLGAYVVAVLGLGLEGDKRPGLEYALPYFLTFTNEIVLFGDAFRNQIPFFQSWSLGVEEKFYVVWPLIGFLVLRRAWRGVALAVVTLGVCLVQVTVHPDWTSWYEPILVGCLLAVLLHDARTFAWLARLARGGWVVAALAALAGAHVLLNYDERLGEALYPFIVAALIVGLVLGDSPVRRVLGGPLAVHVGRRAYGIYLVHILAINAVDLLILPDATFTPATVANLLAAVALSYAVADGLHRTVERPLITVGRRVAARFGPGPAPGTVGTADPGDLRPVSS
ncbi:MAG: acyltransferase [Actinomycetota bacterium]|nr:acyltransferase [Actinomycetota bacterium]